MLPINNEKSVLHCLIMDESMFTLHTSKLEKKWFSEPKYASFIMKLQQYKEKHEKFDIELFITSTGASFDDIHDIMSSHAISSHMEEYAESLRQSYYVRMTSSALFNASKELLTHPDKLTEVLETLKRINVTEMSDQMFIDAPSVAYQMEEKILSDKQRTYDSIGITALDDYVKLHATQVILIAARPAVGKSTLALNIVKNLLTTAPVAFLTLEMSNEEVHKRLLTREHLNAKVDIFDKKNIGAYQQLLVDCEEKHSQLYYLDKPITVERLKVLLAVEKQKHGIKYAVVDHIGLLQTTRKVNNQNERIGYIVEEIKAIAMELEICIFALCQLSRDVEKRGDKTFKLSDLRDSGHLEQTANIVMMLERATPEEEYSTDQKRDNLFEKEEIKQYDHIEQDEMMVHITKNRDGKTGKVKLKFIPELYYIDTHAKYEKEILKKY